MAPESSEATVRQTPAKITPADERRGFGTSGVGRTADAASKLAG